MINLALVKRGDGVRMGSKTAIVEDIVFEDKQYKVSLKTEDDEFFRGIFEKTGKLFYSYIGICSNLSTVDSETGEAEEKPVKEEEPATGFKRDYPFTRLLRGW